MARYVVLAIGLMLVAIVLVVAIVAATYQQTGDNHYEYLNSTSGTRPE